jgi:hypothetical protein
MENTENSAETTPPCIDTTYLSILCASSCLFLDGLTYPFETLKTKIQYNKDEFLSMYRGYKKYTAREGIKTYFKGFTTIIPNGFISNFVWFWTYEKMNKFQITNYDSQEHREKNLKLLFPFFSGCMAELVSMAVHLPFDIVRIRMQVGDYKYKGSIDCVQQIYKKEGLTRFYNAGHIYIITQMLSSGYFFFIYENIRNSYIAAKSVKSLSFYETFLITTISSVFSSICLNPCDVILTRFQMLDSRKNKLRVLSVMWNLIKHEGIGAFFKGLSSRFCISVIYNILFLEVYEFYRIRYGILLI